MKKKKDKYACSFCGKQPSDVWFLVAATSEGPTICDQCLELCNEIRDIKMAGGNLVTKITLEEETPCSITESENQKK